MRCPSSISSRRWSMSIDPHEPVIRRGIDQLSIPRSIGLSWLLFAALFVVPVTNEGFGQARADGTQNSEPRTHWSFRPIGSPVPPVTSNRRGSRPRSTPSCSGSSRTRASSRRPGEPPGLAPAGELRSAGPAAAPEEVDAVPRRRRPDAYERLVDRLLASPHYGERWGRHWLDVVRYADTGGFEADLLYAQRLAVPRLRDPLVRRRQAVRPLHPGAGRRRRAVARRPRRGARQHVVFASARRWPIGDGRRPARIRMADRRRRHHRRGFPRPDDSAAPAATTTSTTRSARPTTTPCRRSSPPAIGPTRRRSD